MHIAVIGAGWVGVTTAAAFAEIGHTVICADILEHRITTLQKGEVPFFEPNLSELLNTGLGSGRLRFTLSNQEAMANVEVVFCCVNTPNKQDGQTDLQAVFAVAKDFAEYHGPNAVFVVKSTVPAGTCAKVATLIREHAQMSDNAAPFAVASNPEFLAESTAIRDTLEPSRIVIGSDDIAAREIVRRVYDPLIANGAKVLLTNAATAEVVKTASNSYLATRISFINEIANYANLVGADPMDVAVGMGMDPRIGSLRPGVGYGGGCFPKDVQSLLTEGRLANSQFSVLQAAHDANTRQRAMLYDRMVTALGDVRGKRIAIWGLAFKPKTDDVRESPGLYFVERLLADGAEVVAFDPKVRRTIAHKYPGLRIADAALDAAKDADAVALLTEWEEFVSISLDDLRSAMRGTVLVDGRYVWHRKEMTAKGFTYVV